MTLHLLAKTQLEAHRPASAPIPRIKTEIQVRAKAEADPLVAYRLVVA